MHSRFSLRAGLVCFSAVGVVTLLTQSRSLDAQIFGEHFQHSQPMGQWQAPVQNFNMYPMPAPVQNHYVPEAYPQPFGQPIDHMQIPQPMTGYGQQNYQEMIPPVGPPTGFVHVGDQWSSQPSSQSVPEGFDPAYPIEYPEGSIQTYYPTDYPIGGMVAPIDGTTAGPVSGGNNKSGSAPMITGEVIEAGVSPVQSPVQSPEQGEPDKLAATEGGKKAESNPVKTPDLPTQPAADSAPSNSELAGQLAKLEQQIKDAELRAKEAEEKAMAITRQAESQIQQMEQLKSKLAKSNNAGKRLKSQAAKKKTAADLARAQTLESVAQSPTKAITLDDKDPQKSKTSKTSKPDVKNDTPANESTPATEPKLVADQKVVNEPKTADAVADNQAQKAKPRKKSLREKIIDLEAAREKQLVSAAKRIRTEYKEKIDEKLDSGKTEKHPEVRVLRESLREKLEDSNSDIRRRYQREINRMWKEAAARSRS